MKDNHHYVVKGQEVFIGLEDSKRTWKICVRSKGVAIHQAAMPAKYEVLYNYITKNYPECAIHLIYEAGFKGFDLHDKIQSDGWDCVVTPPHTVTEEKCQRQKNDSIDCRRLAKNLENGDYKSCFVPDKELREDRQISRLYEQVARDIRRVCNQIRRALEFHGIDEHFTPGSWERSYYRYVKETVAAMDIGASLHFHFSILFEKLEYLWGLRKRILSELRELAGRSRYKTDVKILKSVPGIGALSAIRLVLEWGTVSRFKRNEEFSSCLGLIPSEYSSGDTEHRGHITKQGNRLVRAWLIECAWVAIRHDPALLDKYMRIFKRGGGKKKAIVAVARKLAIRARAVLMKRETYIYGRCA